MISVFEHPWLGGLFGDDEAAALWSAEAQTGHFRAFERALALALEATGHVAPDHGTMAARAIETAGLDSDSLARGTAADGLPIPELVRQLRAAAGKSRAAVHSGATSQDVLDTALTLTLRAVSDLIIRRLSALDEALGTLCVMFGDTPLTGRTRMQVALPITVSDRVRAWRSPLASHIRALGALRPEVERLQLAGAVGTRAAFGAQGPEIVRRVADDLGLQAAPVWHTERSRLAEYAGRLSAISGGLGKMGADVTLMAQQGVDAIRLSGGGGSSAMPHKSNPVLAELLVTLARFNATQLAGVHHALVHEQERSGAAWMLEWMLLPPMTLATVRGLGAAGELCRQVISVGDQEQGQGRS